MPNIAFMFMTSRGTLTRMFLFRLDTVELRIWSF
jgi:hypothetical protein